MKKVRPELLYFIFFVWKICNIVCLNICWSQIGQIEFYRNRLPQNILFGITKKNPLYTLDFWSHLCQQCGAFQIQLTTYLTPANSNYIYLLADTLSFWKCLYSWMKTWIRTIIDKKIWKTGSFRNQKDILTLKAPRKKCIWKCRLLKSSAANNCLCLTLTCIFLTFEPLAPSSKSFHRNVSHNALFQKCTNRSTQPNKKAIIAKNRIFFSCNNISRTFGPDSK